MLSKQKRPSGSGQGVVSEHSSNDANPTIPFKPSTIQALELALYGWPELLRVVPIPRRTIEKLIAIGEFPKASRYLGRRPYWLPEVVRQWAEGGAE